MSKKHDSYESIRDERRYGPYWYSALWRIIRPILIGLGAVLVVAGILFSVWNKVYGEFIAPPDENSTAQVPFTIESGQSLTRVANRLEEAGLIRNRTVFKYYCDFAGWGQKIQSGSYTLSPSMTMRQIADQLTRGDGNPIVRNITLIPGWTIEKDPKVTVKAGSEACYLFVKLEKSANFDTFMTYVMADGWEALPGNADVYYREVAAATADTTFEVLKGNQVSVKGEVTKAQMNALTADTYPTLTVTAYASQLNKNATTEFGPAAAWANIAP